MAEKELIRELYKLIADLNEQVERLTRQRDCDHTCGGLVLTVNPSISVCSGCGRHSQATGQPQYKVWYE